MTAYALKFVRFERIEEHFRKGWVMSFPNAAMHHHYYGCELAWICACPVPGLKLVRETGRLNEAVGTMKTERSAT